jgi:hypothetical protein
MQVLACLQCLKKSFLANHPIVVKTIIVQYKNEMQQLVATSYYYGGRACYMDACYYLLITSSLSGYYNCKYMLQNIMQLIFQNM